MLAVCYPRCGTCKKAVKWLEDNNIEYTALPADDFMVTTLIDFESAVIGKQTAEMNGFERYTTDVAPCRTFVFLHEIDHVLCLVVGAAMVFDIPAATLLEDAGRWVRVVVAEAEDVRGLPRVEVREVGLEQVGAAVGLGE